MEELETQLLTQMEVAKFKFENLFKTSNMSGDEFLKLNTEDIRKYFAQISTDILHKGMLRGIKTEKFINEILIINFKNIEDLKSSISGK